MFWDIVPLRYRFMINSETPPNPAYPYAIEQPNENERVTRDVGFEWHSEE
jgi:hypothetical protein